MNLIFYIYWAAIFQIVEDFENNDAGSLESCKESVCLKKEYNTNLLKASSEHDSSTKALFESKGEESYEVNYHYVKEVQNSEVFSRLLSNFKDIENLIVTENITNPINNSSEVTEVENKYNFNEGDVFTTTVAINVTEKNIKLTNTVYVTIRATPVGFWPFQNTSSMNDICFCDLTLNQCDINCCCDKDCNSAHYKIFTKCSDSDLEIDKNNCFKSSIILRNNTSFKLVKNSGGLFCIVKDNSHFSFHYKTKPIITSLESFNKSVPHIPYFFSPKKSKKSIFTVMDYKVGLPVWTLQDNEIKPFDIPAPSIGFLCTSRMNIKYLVNQVTQCFYRISKNKLNCEVLKAKNLLNFLRTIKIISNPGLFNNSESFDPAKICLLTNCIGINSYLCQFSSGFPCFKVSEKLSFQKFECQSIVSKIVYHIKHNGTEGIKEFAAYIWLRNTSTESGDNYLQATEIKYSWIAAPEKILKRSGNPGYQIGRPIIAGKKVYFITNSTADKKEAIQLSLDSNEWLTVLANEKGLCSSKKRISINFKENSQYSCSLELTKDMFHKDKCIALQNKIFKLLIGNEIVNATTENYFNKFVATSGNPKVENTGHWVQVMIDLFPVISSQVGFKSHYNNIMCKNIITDLFIDIAYADIGSFSNPQSKILGVLFHFGKHKDLMFYCDTPGCANTSSVQLFKLSTTVNFIDLTGPAVDMFAEPLGLEIKFSHDFFYPFFSKANHSQLSKKFKFVLLLLTISLSYIGLL